MVFVVAAVIWYAVVMIGRRMCPRSSVVRGLSNGLEQSPSGIVDTKLDSTNDSMPSLPMTSVKLAQ